ncbi:diaminopropionate ammonia-lyase [Salipiger abyssi]|uniref:diaminopropionate ammonia-lyase n=1 Tax=Salipiger abyssi TaxID=1250539 RepID=UPI001A8E4308|nr:diaminopropionate ammonia-lyase [Salipiger abyssi]MBN9888579.1 diaminopropionate ammonia-lyase [Salipiger abyssi]
MTSSYEFVANPLAKPDGVWRPAQDDILSDRAFAAAYDAISHWPGYAPTPLHALADVAAEFGVATMRYKDESARFGLGSFKALGGAYAVARLLRRELSARLGREIPMQEIIDRAHPEAAEITVCCATDGNHGRSVAWGAQRFGARCVIFIHETVSEGRRAAIAQYGAEVRRTPGNYDASLREAQETADAEGWFVVSDTSYPGYTDVPRDVMQGYEIMAAEAFDALPEAPTHIFVQTGVGGMAAAVAASATRRYGAARPRLVLADPLKADCWLKSFRAGAPVADEGELDTMMAGLACGEVSLLAWEILKDHCDAAVGVPEEAVPRWMRRLAAGAPPVVAGESAVAGLAAAEACCGNATWRTALGLSGTSRILVFGSEGDTDEALYRQIVGG